MLHVLTHTYCYADTIGSTIFNPPYGAQFEWKLNTTVGYDFGPGAISFNWRHTPRTRHVAKATNPAAEQLDIPAYNIVDLISTFRVSDMLEMRFGVDNLLDKEPEIFGAIPGVTAAVGEPEPGGSFDVLGRRYYIGAKLEF